MMAVHEKQIVAFTFRYDQSTFIHTTTDIITKNKPIFLMPSYADRNPQFLLSSGLSRFLHVTRRNKYLNSIILRLYRCSVIYDIFSCDVFRTLCGVIF